MGSLAFGAGYFGQYALGGAISATLLDPICTGHIGYGETGDNGSNWRGHIADTVGGIVEEDVEEEMLVCQ